MPFLVTTGLWLAAKARLGWPEDPSRAASQILSLWVLVAFSIVMLIAARNRTVEKIYGGLDKSYRLHGRMAKIAWIGMLLHPPLLIPSLLERGFPWWSALVPFGPWPAGAEIARVFGVVGFYLFIVLVALTLWRKMDYQNWLLSHNLMGVAFLASSIHAFLALSDLRAFEPLRDWMLLCCGAGVLAWLYKSFLYPFLAQQYEYVVADNIDHGHGIRELVLRPVGPRMNFEPGEFAFLSVRGHPVVPPEHHPFSILSTPGKHELRFGIREVGDYTRRLRELRSGDSVRVYGPYGEFTIFMLDEFKKQVWIAGGIGITPFSSMAEHEVENGDPKKIWLITSVLVREQAVFQDRLCALARRDPQFRPYLHVTEEEGLLTADRVEQLVGPEFPECAFLLCGPPPMMRALRAGLSAKGIPKARIFFEEFDFV